jgi:4-amino-4-deoxy-L-arabinose transferase-like glycosyltransferase
MNKLGILKSIYNYKVALILILLVATALRFYNLDFQSPWLDEIHTLVEIDSSLSLQEFYDIMFLRELMPHLYYFITRVFGIIFCDSIFVARSISAIAGVLSIYALFVLGKELISKKVGLFAALFLAVNHFHIYYSQEARPYALLSLFTTLSFLYLLRFLKQRDLKSALFYALFAGLMIDTHFFGLFVLVSQVVLILINLFSQSSKEKKTFFINSCIAGAVIILLFIPSIPVLFRISSVESFWIPPPSNSFFKELFNVFFGKSEFIIYTAILLIIAYFFRVFSTKNNKFQLSFVLLILWLFTIFVIPFIRSYTNVPMLINRYFISALPAAILLVAIGLSTIKSKTVINIICFAFVFSSLVDLFIVKDYYNKITKTQFRELTAEVKEKNTENSPIVYRMAWHMEYFFDKNELEIINGELDNYLDRIKSRYEVYEDFWIIGAHMNPYKVKPENQTFLDKNFYLIDEIEYHDCWAKYYVFKNNKQIERLDLSGFSPRLTNDNSKLTIKSNRTITSKNVNLSKGKYRLALRTKSTPNPPINNENAHVDVSINGNRIGGFYTSSVNIETTLFDFNLDKDTQTNIQITFDNDYFDLKSDRDLILYEVTIEKIINLE